MSDSEDNSSSHNPSDNEGDIEDNLPAHKEAGSPEKTAHEEAENTKKRPLDLDSTQMEEGRSNKKFCLPTLKDSEDIWKLPGELAKNFNDRCSNHMKESELEQFLDVPPPSNINQSVTLDPYMKPLLEKRGKVQSKDHELCKIHEKLFLIMGPLGKVWAEVQKFFDDTDEEDIDPETCVSNLNSAIVLLAQAINSLAYERRLSVLTTISDHKSAKSQLKDNAKAIMEESKHLFGEAFRKNMKDLTKAKESAEKIFSNKDKPTKYQQKIYQQPFSPRPSYNGPPRGAGGARYQRRGGLFRGKRGKSNFNNFKSEICTSKFKTDFLQGSPKSEGYKCRKNSLFRKKLENTIRGPPDFGNSTRLETASDNKTIPKQRAEKFKYVTAGTNCSRQGSTIHDRETGDKGGGATGGPISVHNICSPQKGEKQISPYHKPETTKQISPILPLQDGRDKKCEKSIKEGGFLSKNRPQGSLLAHTNPQDIPKISKIQVETKALRNASTRLRSGAWPKDLYKINESASNIFAKTDDTHSYLPGRHVTDREDPGGSIDSQRLSDFSVNTPRSDHKLGEICLGTNPDSRISRNDNRFKNNENNFTSRKNSKTKKYLPGDTSGVKTYSETPIEFNREVICHTSSHISSTTSNQIFTTKSDTGSKAGIRIWENHTSIQGGKNRTKVVDKQFGPYTGKPDTLSESRNDNLLRRIFPAGLGSSNGRGFINRGNLVTGGKGNFPHQRIGVDSGRTSHKDFYQGKESVVDSYLHRQHDSLVIPNKKGGTKSKSLIKISKRIWEYALDKGITITASWIPSAMNKRADQMSRQKPNSREWELSNRVFKKLTLQLGIPDIDCFASRTMKKLNNYMSLNQDPWCKATNALYQKWDKLFPYLFPPFCLIGRVLEKIQKQQVEQAILIAPLWPGQAWYPALLQMIVADPLVLPNSAHLLKNHKGESHHLIVSGNLKLGAFLISSNNLRQREYQKTLLKSCSTLKETVQLRLTHRVGKSGFCGVIKNKWIPLIPL